MVLSNKKLKRKLRSNLAESLTASMSQTYNDSSPPDPISKQTQSLKNLTVSEIQKPRLSKREKRRKNPPGQKSGGVNGGNDGLVIEEKMDIDLGRDESGEKPKKKKKRKRDEVAENGGSVSAEKTSTPNKKAKKKKKKKQKKGKKVKKEDENTSGEIGNGEHSAIEVNAMHIDAVSAVTNDESGDAATKVYVGGIPYYSTEDDIWSYFESCGTIVEIECMTFADSGKFRGIAIINFKTEAAAKRALDLDGADMGGLFLKIQPYKATREPKPTSDFSPEIVEGYNRIYMGNLAWDITEDDVKNFFSDCKISAIRFGKNKETGDFKGYAHVDFSDSLSLTLALKLDQEIVRGRPVKIRCAVRNRVEGYKKPEPKAPGESKRVNIKNEDESKRVYFKKEEESKPVYVKTTEEESMKESDFAMGIVSSGKIKRRTCYLCGEKGHLSSACPNQKESPVGESKKVCTKTEEESRPVYVKAEEEEEDVAMGGASSGKIKRRTCYVCGEKGHLSSACPNQNDAPVGESKRVDTKIEDERKKENMKRDEEYKKEMARKEEEEKERKNDEAKASVSIGKIKRRTCYECGEKGHLSSDCPKKSSLFLPADLVPVLLGSFFPGIAAPSFEQL